MPRHRVATEDELRAAAVRAGRGAVIEQRWTRMISERERDPAMPGFEVWKELGLVHAVVSGELDRALESNHGLSLHSFELLSAVALAPQGRLRMSELATRLRLTPSGVTRLVERLERDNFVVRARDTFDRRVVHARMTARGTAKLHDATDTYRAVVSELFAHRISAREMIVLGRLVRTYSAEQMPVAGVGSKGGTAFAMRFP